MDYEHEQAVELLLRTPATLARAGSAGSAGSAGRDGRLLRDVLSCLSQARTGR
jgi:hypothetical protein